MNEVFKIKKSCSENWSKMKENDLGCFCDSCQKCVVDLESKSFAEIEELISNDSTCVRISQRKLDTFNQTNHHTYKPNFYFPNWMKIPTFLGVLGFIPNVSAQIETTKIIKSEKYNIGSESVKTKRIVGVLKDNMGFPLSDELIEIKELNLETYTDFDGNFSFDIPIEIKQIRIDYHVQFEDVNYILVNDFEKPIHIIVDIDEIVMGEVVIVKSKSSFFHKTLKTINWPYRKL